MHVHAVLSAVFSWSDGDYEFTEQPRDDLTEGADVALRASTGDLILEATRSVKDPDVVRYNLGDIDRVLGLSSDPLLRFQRIALTPADGYMLSRVDGSLSAREVMQLIPLEPEDAQRCLFGLLSTGVVEYLDNLPRKQAAPVEKKGRKPVAPPPTPEPESLPEEALFFEPESDDGPATAPPPPEPVRAAAAPPPPEPAAAAEPPPSSPPPAVEAPPAPPPAQAAPRPPRPAVPMSPAEARRNEILEAFLGLRTLTHYEMLEIERDASDAQVKEAYFRMAKRFHPDVHHDEALHDLRDKLEAVFIRLGEAYEVLRNPRMRASYERQLGPRAGPERGAQVAPQGDDPAAPGAAWPRSRSCARPRAWRKRGTGRRSSSWRPSIARVDGRSSRRAACCSRAPTRRTPTGRSRRRSCCSR